MSELLESVRSRIFIYDEAMLYPGHGENTTVKEEMESNPFFA